MHHDCADVYHRKAQREAFRGAPKGGHGPLIQLLATPLAPPPTLMSALPSLVSCICIKGFLVMSNNMLLSHIKHESFGTIVYLRHI